MEGARDCYCILCSSACCAPYPEEEISSSSTSFALANICKLIGKSKKCVGEEDGGGCGGKLGKMLKELEESREFSVCTECSVVTAVALESRGRAEEMEGEVRILQRQLLELLRRLQEEMEVFQQEIRKIEGAVRRTAGVSNGGGRLMEDPLRSVEGRMEVKKAELVRDQILEVVTDLRFFQSDLTDKLILRRGNREEMESEEDEDNSSIIPGVSSEMNFVPETEDEVEVVTCDASLIEEEDDGEGTGGGYSGYLGHYMLGGDGGDLEENEMEEDDDGPISDEDGGYGESVIKRTPSPRKRSPQKPRKPAKFKSVNLSKVTAFKKGLIKRAIERETKRKEVDDWHENPLIKYFLRYDPPTDSFFVGEVQVVLRDIYRSGGGAGAAISESRLECTGVGCNTTWSPPPNNEHTTTFDRDVRNHVIGKHLGGFRCRVCAIVLDSYFKLMSHFKKSHPGQKPLNGTSIMESPRHPTTPNGVSNGHHGSPPRFSSLDKFRKNTPNKMGRKRAGGSQQQAVMQEELQVPSSPSEGLKQVRMTMKSAIESLGEVPPEDGGGPPNKKTRRSSRSKGKRGRRT